ncbi:Dabb family protein [Emticicia sp. CRIBPO]|uniref:Dabb family protein n=1 Tax=Emticicia sp. CRIBPO TaxID=2683258 RepID=UPI00141202D5|nr:Dabb family protein [Emticicia sp. CRIBPO]NBA87078.1 Dabb family protein [Emticicia sp. CRIBPO]
MKDSNRRKFIKNAGLAALATAAPIVSEAAKTKEVFVHHVYFYLKNPKNAADTAKLIEGLTTLSKIKEIQFVHIGTPASTNRSVIEKGYDVSWLLFFKNLMEEEIYQTHPVHLKFIEDYSHLWEKVIVYDSINAK